MTVVIQLKIQCKNTPFISVILTEVILPNCVQDLEEKNFKKLLRAMFMHVMFLD